jgi:hypothetical protein
MDALEDACSSNGRISIAPPPGTLTTTSPHASRARIASLDISLPRRCERGTTLRAPLRSPQSSR